MDALFFLYWVCGDERLLLSFLSASGGDALSTSTDATDSGSIGSRSMTITGSDDGFDASQSPVQTQAPFNA